MTWNHTRRDLQVRRLRELAQANDQRRSNGTLYKRFWTLQWDSFFNGYIWTLNAPYFQEDVLALAEVGVRGR